MIQDISPLRLDNTYADDVVPDNDSIVFHFNGRNVLYRKDSANPFPVCADYIPTPENNLHSTHSFPVYADYTIPDNLIYLFSIEERKYFLLTDSVIVIPDGFAYVDINSLRKMESCGYFYHLALATAFHLSHWYSNNRFCGKCGGNMVTDRGERALKCTFCGRKVYPRINPAVIVGVTNGNRLLITRYTASRGVPHDALIAGFTEIGETLEETVKREVREETGLEVKNIRYYKSQPWGASQSILAGFFCDADGSTEIRLDESELSSAEWTERSDITGQPDNLSLTNEMMMKFREGII